VRPGVLVRQPGSGVDRVMARFALNLKVQGVRVAGLLQPGGAGAMDLLDIASGRLVDIAQRLGGGSVSCRLDTAALADASGALRRGIAEGADLLVYNKFGPAEAQGGGLAGEFLEALSEGFPVLTSVAERLLDDWTRFIGAPATCLDPDTGSLEAWWRAQSETNRRG
jgi:hypothetical protein